MRPTTAANAAYVKRGTPACARGLVFALAGALVIDAAVTQKAFESRRHRQRPGFKKLRVDAGPSGSVTVCVPSGRRE